VECISPVWKPRRKEPTLNRPDNSDWVKSIIDQFVESPENNLRDSENNRAFDKPLVGFSSGADPIFEEFKTHAGEFHWTPAEIFRIAFPGSPITDPGMLSVISWALPQTEATRKSNRKETEYPSEPWARNRIYGEEFNERLRSHLVNMLMSEGFEAVAPSLHPLWEVKPSERYVFSSNWSERHAAFASGLGTFGLCDGLITRKGKAVRFGSVVARIEIPPTPRPYRNHHEYCLFYSKGACGKCIRRCPAGALTSKGHDKTKCRQHTHVTTAEYVKSKFGFSAYGCGLCQTGVPCESRIPTIK